MKRLLFIGDVVGYGGCQFLWENLRKIKQEHSIDITVVNGENSAKGNGITVKSAEHILSCGADVITTGNHAFKRKECVTVFEKYNILRPINYPEGVMGVGACTLDFGGYKAVFINLIGTVYLEPVDNPFFTIDKALEGLETPNIFVDFHAEATAEKKAMGHYLAGRVTAMMGTHTHVQTNDAMILGEHTGYITDVGMTGAEFSVIGTTISDATTRQKYHIPIQFTEAEGDMFMCGVVVAFDEKTGKCTKIYKLIVR